MWLNLTWWGHSDPAIANIRGKAINENIEQEATIVWLLEPENSSVRYLTLTKLVGRSERNPEVREARSAIYR